MEDLCLNTYTVYPKVTLTITKQHILDIVSVLSRFPPTTRMVSAKPLHKQLYSSTFDPPFDVSDQTLHT